MLKNDYEVLESYEELNEEFEVEGVIAADANNLRIKLCDYVVSKISNKIQGYVVKIHGTPEDPRIDINFSSGASYMTNVLASCYVVVKRFSPRILFKPNGERVFLGDMKDIKTFEDLEYVKSKSNGIILPWQS